MRNRFDRQLHIRAQGEVSSPLSRAFWGTFPGSRRHSPEGSGQGPGPAIGVAVGVEIDQYSGSETSGVEMSSIRVGGEAPARARVRHQVREAVAVMAFSAAVSLVLATALYLLGSIGG